VKLLELLQEVWRPTLAFSAPSEPIDSCDYPHVIVSEAIEAESSPSMLLEIRRGDLGVISSITLDSRLSPYLTETEVLFGSDATKEISTELLRVYNQTKFREREKQNADASAEPHIEKSTPKESQHRKSIFRLCMRKALDLILPVLYQRNPELLCKFRTRCYPGKYCEIQIRNGTGGLISRLTIIGRGEDPFTFYLTKTQTESLVRTFAKFHVGNSECENNTSGAK
jgi:hypothetical protein